MSKIVSDFYVVRVKLPLKAETFKLFKSITPAMAYMRRMLRFNGASASIGGFDWEERDHA